MKFAWVIYHHPWEEAPYRVYFESEASRPSDPAVVGFKTESLARAYCEQCLEVKMVARYESEVP